MHPTEKKIIESAHDLFLKFGFKKTSMDEIAAEAGIGKGTIYNYFKNKEHLFEELSRYVHSEVARLVDQSLNNLPDDPVDRLMEWYLIELRHMKKKIDLFRTPPQIMQELLQVALSRGFEEVHFQDYLQAFLEYGISQKVFREMDVKKSIISFQKIVSRFMIDWLYMDDEAMEKEVREILGVIIQGFKA